MQNARMSYRELGDRVSLSANAAAERVRRLQERGVIAGFQAIVNPEAAGLGFWYFNREAPRIAEDL